MLELYLVSAIFLLTVLSIFVNRGVIDSKYLNFLDIPYYWSPLLGASLVILFTGVGLEQVYQGITGMSFSQGFSFLSSSGPFSTIILFLSVAFVSLSLEVSGFFRYLAVKVLKVVDGSGKWLFVAVFWLSGILALFTSNDILILTFTPFLLEFLDLAELDAIPFLIAEFFAANVFSMVFLIGNETNIIVATTHNLGFLSFFQYMVLPGIVGGLACFGALYLIFRERIDFHYEATGLPDLEMNRWEVLSSSLLVGTLLSLAVFSTFGFLLWHVALLWAGITVAVFILPDLFEKREVGKDGDLYLSQINDKMPWEVVPFLLGFFILVQAFSVIGLTEILLENLTSLTRGGLLSTVFGVGFLSTISANFLNNIPMTVLFSDILSGYSSGITQFAALYSLVIGSNIGANITPIGALAGIMWIKMVNHAKKRITFREFFQIGWKVTLVTALASLTTLYVVIVF